ncbi:MAG: type II secretion system F family protein [Candidatus Ratteibacteria bacterium]|nr:type II secretion system F family protein [Candidatus Ratteibacteria bacterium]
MPTFSYVALDIHGEEIKGFLEATNLSIATAQLRDMGYFPTTIREQTAAVGKGAPARGARPAGGGMQINIKIPGLTTRVGIKDLTTFTRELATLIDAGLPVVRSLNILKEQSKGGALKDILTDIVENIEGGSSLSEALSRHPKTFSKLYINMMKAGEVGGVLEQVLDKTAQFLEKDMSLKRKIKGAMMYPILVTCAIVGILSVIMIFVIPQFISTLKDLAGDAPLPGPTQLLLHMVNLVTGRDFFKVPNFVWVILGIILFIIIYKVIVTKFLQVRYLMDMLKLKLPIFGVLVKKSTVARFARTFGTLITSGVPVLQALNIVKDTSGNEVLSKNVITVHDAVREGESIARPMSQSKFFPPMVINMVDVGEETGALDNMLIKVADSYEADVDVAVEGLSSLMEPILIIIMGVIVGSIVIALYMPLIGIAQGISASAGGG